MVLDYHVLNLFFNVYFLKGQLGVGKDIKYQSTPDAIPKDLLPRPVVQITCGETTSAAVTGNISYTSLELSVLTSLIIQFSVMNES